MHLLQVPTWRANPLHPECDTWCEFPVADRPNAVQQWIDAAKRDPTMIKVSTCCELVPQLEKCNPKVHPGALTRLVCRVYTCPPVLHLHRNIAPPVNCRRRGC